MRLPFNFIRTHPRSKRTTTNTREPEHEETLRPDTDMTVIENTNEHSAHIISKDARVYLHYDVENPPPSPGDDWTRFICLSDTHSNIYPVPDGDVLLHSGDLSSWGHLSQLKRTMTWLTSLPHPVKMYVSTRLDPESN